ncbi:MAG: hypothetical protein ACLGXA_04540 [Acidobacteriota bacterium]
MTARFDGRELTVRELCQLAEEVRSAPVGSRELRRAADRMAIAATYLEATGALQQMMWWAGADVAPEPPPDALEGSPAHPPAPGATILEFPVDKVLSVLD